VVGLLGLQFRNVFIKCHLPNELHLSYEVLNVDILFRTFKKDLILV